MVMLYILVVKHAEIACRKKSLFSAMVQYGALLLKMSESDARFGNASNESKSMIT